jgi:hypothetical protein
MLEQDRRLERREIISVEGCHWEGRRMIWDLPTYGGGKGTGSPNDPAPKRRRPQNYL